MKRKIPWIGWGVAVVALLFVIGIAGISLYFRSTLPSHTNLESNVAGSVRLEYDSLGVPTVRGESLLDVLHGQGFAVARDRLFQMDLIRRRTLGQLAEILGPALVSEDRLRRTYGFPDVTRRAVEGMAPALRARFQAFADGVNAFLKTGPLPPEIRILGYQPKPWRPEDSVAVALSMFDPPDLKFESLYTALVEKFPKPVVDWITTDSGFLDAEMTGPAADPLTIPPNFSLRALAPSDPPLDLDAEPPKDGSNAWAVAGATTESGMSLLAGDPHLSLSVPNIWYRVKMETPQFWVVGASLPGFPGVVIGTNGQVAWTFTNPSSDLIDVIQLNALSPTHYGVNGTPTAYGVRTETIRVKGEADQTIRIQDTKWGPVMEEGFAVQWVALDPAPLTKLDVLGLNQSRNLSEAMKALEGWAGPAHNAVVADGEQVAWLLVGNIPRRKNLDGALTRGRDSSTDWDGYFSPDSLPRVTKKEGWVVNANQRPFWGSLTPGQPSHRDIGRNWPVDGRAHRIRQLMEEVPHNKKGMKQIQMDLTSPTHLYYRDLLTGTPPPTEDDPWWTAIQRVARDWDGQLGVDSGGYPLMKLFRKRLLATWFDPFVKKLPKVLWTTAYQELDRDAVVRQLLEARPEAWLPRPFESYDEMVRSAANEAAKALSKSPAALGTTPWGQYNRANIKHPFSAILPGFLAGWVNMAPSPLPGDVFVPRAAKPDHSSTLRMIVDLGDLPASIYSQPGGQSGHFLSPHFRDQQEDWVNGRYQPLLPGKTVATVFIKPLSKGTQK